MVVKSVGEAPYAEPVAEGEQFVERNLRRARFVESDLSDVVMRGVEIAGMDIDAPWLSEGRGLLVNGVDVAPFVEQELDRRFPGRSQRRAQSPAGLRAAWTLSEQAWDAAIAQAAALPEGSVEIKIDHEWSFAETLRHLVHATDLWLGRSVLGLSEGEFHPLGLGHGSTVPATLRMRMSWPHARTEQRWCATTWPPSPTTCSKSSDPTPTIPLIPDRAPLPARDPRRELGTLAIRAA